MPQSLADFGDDEYHKMVCIEPGIVSKFHRWAETDCKEKNGVKKEKQTENRQKTNDEQNGKIY